MTAASEQPMDLALAKSLLSSLADHAPTPRHAEAIDLVLAELRRLTPAPAPAGCQHARTNNGRVCLDCNEPVVPGSQNFGVYGSGKTLLADAVDLSAIGAAIVEMSSLVVDESMEPSDQIKNTGFNLGLRQAKHHLCAIADGTHPRFKPSAPIDLALKAKEATS